ncbi:MAG: hypothetical protein JXA13_00295 [Anaerolineales bacterium]|nr:hypothetical protein [Anaerolineales bacterium]
MNKRVQRTTSMLMILAVALGACRPGEAPDASAIATAAVQTVEARYTQQALLAGFTPTPESAAGDAAATPAGPTATKTPSTGGQLCDLSASLVSETIPDGQIMSPGQQFFKTWTLKNTGTCTWDSSYKLVYWDGDMMGSAYVYDFPGYAAPEDTVDVSILLYAPEEDGQYQGFWRIQSPQGAFFGVGQYDESLWAQIVVSSEDEPGYGVTSVTYDIVRDPPFGCDTINTRYYFYATVTVSGPVEIKYHWSKSDGTYEGGPKLVFDEAGSQTVSIEWLFRRGVTTKERYVQFHIDKPVPQSFGELKFTFDCQ